MKITDTLTKLKEYQELQKELEEIKQNQLAYERKIITETTNNYDNLCKTIQQFCGNESFQAVIKNFCYLYSGILSISNGNLAYHGIILPPLVFNNDNVFIITRQCINDIKSSFVALAGKSCNTENEIKKLCVAFSTLRNINARVNILKENAIKIALAKNNRKEQVGQKIKELLQEYPDFQYPEKIKEQIENLKNKQKEEFNNFNFKNMVLPTDYTKEISLPFGIIKNKEDINIKYWNPLRDGILHINISSGDSSIATNFISALIMQFLYSYPLLDKQILYCCKNARSEMDNFIGAIKDIFKGSIFFKEKEQLQNMMNDYDFGETIKDLRNEGRIRSERMKGLNIYEYNAQEEVDIISPILIIFNDYPDCISRDYDLEYFFKDCINLGIFCVVLQTKFNERDIDLTKYKSLKCDLIDEGININNTYYTGINIDKTIIKSLLTNINEKGKKTTYLSYEEIGFGKNNFNTDGYCTKISIPIGKVNNKIFSLDFAMDQSEEDKKNNKKTPMAYLIIGSPKSGKSSLLDALIINGSMAYSPDDLIFYFLDFKIGTTASSYDYENAIQHVKMIANGCQGDDADIILSELMNEQERRYNIFQENRLEDIAGYNRQANKKMPRLIVIVDECQDLFANDNLAQKCRDLVRKGRAAGIHLVLASQEPDFNMMKYAGNFIDGRFCFYVGNKDFAAKVIDREYTKSLESDIPNSSGLAYVSLESGHNCEKIRVAFFGKEVGNKKAKYNEQIRKKWNAKGYRVKLIKAGDMNPLKVNDYSNDMNSLITNSPNLVSIGESYFDHSILNIEIFTKEPSSDKIKGNSIIIHGDNENISSNILSSIIIKALSMKGQIKLIDETFDQTLERYFGTHSNITLGTRDNYLDLLQEVYEEYTKRKKDYRGKYEPYFVIINNLSRIDDYKNNVSRRLPSSNKINSGDDWTAKPQNANLNGKDTLFSMLSEIRGIPNMCFAIALGDINVEYFDQKALANCGYKIIQNNAISNDKKVKKGLNENVVLVLSRQESLKCRYFQYDFNDPKIDNIIKTIINN